MIVQTQQSRNGVPFIHNKLQSMSKALSCSFRKGFVVAVGVVVFVDVDDAISNDINSYTCNARLKLKSPKDDSKPPITVPVTRKMRGLFESESFV